METQKKSPIVPVLVGAVILILIGAGIYFLRTPRQASLSPAMQIAKQQVLKDCKYDADFCKYAANGMAAMTGGVTMTSESTYNGKTSKMIMRTDGKNNTTSTTYTDNKEEGSFISLNGTTYMKGPNETVWTEFPPAKTDSTGQTQKGFDFESFKKEITESVKDTANTLEVKRVGTKPCGFLTCILFEMKEKTLNSTTVVWVDTKEYLARKMEMNTKEGSSTMTFEYGAVTITKPAPVKQMPSFEETMKEKGVNVDMEEIQKMMQQAPQEETPVQE